MNSRGQLAVLLDQHKEIRALFRALETERAVRPHLLRQLHSLLDLHIFLEECYVYPVLENYDNFRSQVYGLWSVHENLRDEIQGMLLSAEKDVGFEDALDRVRTLFEEHAREEENRIFPEARKLLGRNQLELLNKRLDAAIHERKIAA